MALGACAWGAPEGVTAGMTPVFFSPNRALRSLMSRAPGFLFSSKTLVPPSVAAKLTGRILRCQLQLFTPYTVNARSGRDPIPRKERPLVVACGLLWVRRMRKLWLLG